MSKAKKDILKNVREALTNVPNDETPSDITVPRAYRQKGQRSRDQRLALFIERLSDYKASVEQVDQQQLKDVAAKRCRNEQIDQLVVPEGFPEQWIPETATPLFDRAESPLSHQELDGADGVISTCALAIAQTGTIILNSGPGQGRRALSLLPDYHLCIVRIDQIVELVPEGIVEIESSVTKDGAPVTMISGPSATSDIELNRVEGVHGPRTLDVLVI